MKTMCLMMLAAALYTTALSRPLVVIYPFESLTDSTYNIWRDKIGVLDYQRALQTFLYSNLMSRIDIEVVKAESLSSGENEAVAAAKLMQADFAVVGSYAELPTAIRVDAQVIDVALGKVPRGYQASSVATSWDGLSGVADDLAAQLIELILSSTSARRESQSLLVLEGDRSSLGYSPGTEAMLIIEVNSPAPEISLSNGVELKRCSVKDRSLAAGTQSSQICYSAEVAAGKVEIAIDQRGYYGTKESVSLLEGKVYRLIVQLESMSFQTVPR